MRLRGLSTQPARWRFPDIRWWGGLSAAAVGATASLVAGTARAADAGGTAAPVGDPAAAWIWAVPAAMAAAAFGIVIGRHRAKATSTAAGPAAGAGPVQGPTRGDESDYNSPSLRDAPIPIMIHREDGRILAVNKLWTTLTGYEPADLPDIDAWNRLAFGKRGSTAQSVIERLYQEMDQGSVRPVHTADGRTIWWEFTSTPLGQTADGRRTVMTIANDITERRGDEQRLKDSESRYRIISELMSDTVYAYDLTEDGRMHAKWQVGAIEGLGARGGKGAEPLAWLDLVHPDDVPIIEARNQRLRRGQPSTDEFRLKGSDGRTRWLRVFSRPERDGDGAVVRVIGAAKEITQDKRWEEALADSESRLQATSRIARVGYWEYSPHDGRTFCSPVMWQTWGMRPGHLSTGEPPSLQAVHPDDRERVAAIYAGPKDSAQLEYRISRPDGEIRYVYEDLNIEFDAAGEPARYFGVTQDVTGRKLAEEALRGSEARYHAIVEDQTEMIRRCTPTGVRTFVNEAYCQFFGRAREDLIGRVEGAELPTEEADERLAVIARLNPDHPIEENIQKMTRPDGTVCWHHWTDRVVLDERGQVVEIQGVGRDVTDMKLAEEALADAKEAAEHASAAKSRFLAAASHDLRQPLQALAMFVNVLSGRDVDEKARQLIERIGDCSEALERLLGSLLDISKLDAGLFVPQRREFAVSTLTGRLFSEIRPLALEKGLELRHVPSSLMVDSDPGLLDRILRNLLTNAIRHTQEGRILLGCRRRGREVVIEVWDTGAGIPDDQLDLIFEEFHQVGNPARDRREGLGLGLAIVDRLGRLLDHPIQVRSEEGRGSVFAVSLPLAGEQAMPVSDFAEAEPSDVAGALVVGIDDEVDIREALDMLLRDWGYDVLVAESAVQALLLLEEKGQAPDLVVADYRLKQGHTGADAILAIRHVWGMSTPGFLLTGDTGPDRLREATASGFEVMHKPIQADRLRHMVAASIKTKRERDTARLRGQGGTDGQAGATRETTGKATAVQ